MAEHNAVLKLLKDGKLSEKPYAGGKSDIWQDFVQATHAPAMILAYIDYMSLFWDTFHSKLTSSLLIYHNFIIDKMCYQAEWNGFVGWICIWPTGHTSKRPLVYINASYVLISV